MPSAPKLGVASVAAIVASVPIIGIFVHRGFVPLILAIAAIAIVTIGAGRLARMVPIRAIVLLAAFCAWCAVSSLWALDAADAFAGSMKLAGNFIAGALVFAAVLLMEPDEKRTIAEWFTIGWVCALVLIGIEVLFEGPMFKMIFNIEYSKSVIGPFWLTVGTATLIMTFWPVAIILKRKWGWIAPICAFLALIGLTFKVQYGSGFLAVMLGAAGAAAVYLIGRRIAPVFAVVFIAIGLAAPFSLVQLGTPAEATSAFEGWSNSVRHRIGIWTFTSHHILEHPVRGWGMNAARNLPDGKQRLSDLTGYNLGESLPLHPHNMLLQFWLELGLIGALAYLAGGAYLLYRAAHAHLAPVCCGFVLSALVLANISFGAWQAWWSAALWLGGAITIAATRSERVEFIG